MPFDNSINKHGLKRYIPSDIRLRIRKDAGFGCVICGCILIDYEHIDPEFHQATEHDPDKMTLLCISCHGRVTRKLISKKAVLMAKENPKALQDGFVHDILFVNTDEMEIKIGSSVSKNTKVILTIYGKPIIWFEPPLIEGEPSKLCAIFYDNNGKVISYVNRNQFIAYTNNPMAYKPGISQRSSRKKASKNGTSGASNTNNQNNKGQQSGQEHNPHPKNITFPIPLRSDLVVEIKHLPHDLTEQEAEKISMVIKALAMNKG